jgi:hypothetical protein
MKITYRGPNEGEEDDFHSIEIEEHGRVTAKMHLAETEVPSLDDPADLIEIGGVIQQVGQQAAQMQAER